MRGFKSLLIVAALSLFILRPALAEKSEVAFVAHVAYMAQAPDLKAILADYVGADEPGVVLLVSNPAGTWVEARGLADLSQNTPIKTSDHFRIASTSKMFVSVVVQQLAEEGRLTLDDPMSRYLDAEISDQIANGEAMTIRQLLNMTSGIFNYTESDDFYDAVYDDPQHVWTAAETVRYAYNEDAYFAPGEGYYYSNTNYNLLQLIIENVTQSTLGEQVDARIFQPLGMKNSFVESGTQLGAKLVHGYGDDDGDGSLDDVTLMNDGVGLGDGGVITTADDLALFMRGLFQGKLLKSLDAIMDWVDDGEDGLYGLGLENIETEFGNAYGHSGASSGFQSNAIYIPDADVVVVVLTNNFDSEVVEWITEDAIYAVGE